MREVSTVTFGS